MVLPDNRKARALLNARCAPRVLIGPFSKDPAESVSAVNRALVAGLEGLFTFFPLAATRTHGTSRQASINCTNGYYFTKQLAQWTVKLVRHRPQIAHYAISSGWAMEKSLVFMGIARLLGVKTIGHLHSGGFIDHWQTLPPSRKRFAFSELNKLDALVLLSDGWKKTVSEHVRLKSERMFVVNNPIDPGFEQAALQMPVRRADNHVLALGVMGRPKGVIEIIESCKAAKTEVNFQIHLVGPEREPGVLATVHDFVQRNGLQEVIQIKPGVFGPEKLRLFRDCSVFLLPSFYENFPLVLLEAAAAGQAIITTPVGATPEFFAHESSALFVEPGNAQQITKALVRLLRNPEERLRFGQAARDVFTTRLARSKIMDQMNRVYQAVLAPHWS